MIAHDLALALVRYEKIYLTFKPKMSITQFIVMGAIEQGKTHAQAKISEHTGLQQPVVRDIVHRLYRKKFVRRTVGKGFKAGRPIAFTDAGVKAYEECEAIIRRADSEFFVGAFADHATRRSFIDLLQAVTT